MRMTPTFAVIAKALVRPALWFCVSNLLVAALSAQCSNPTQVANQTISSGSHTFSDNNALKATGVTINGSASVTFVAGNCIELGPGFRATAGTAPTTFHAWVETAPSAVSVSPASGSGANSAFTWTVSSPSGYGNLSEMQAIFNTSLSGVNACYIQYLRGANLLRVADINGSNWSSGVVPGSSGTTGSFNPNCTINGIGSGVNSSGTQLSVTASITFQSAFGGTMNNYLIAYDQYGLNSGWQQKGTWIVPAPPAPDFTLTTAMNSYSVQTGGPSNVSYTLTVTPQNGFNSPVSFSMSWPMYGCSSPSFNPAVVTGPPWTTTVTMQCYESYQNTYWTTVTASGGGKSHQLNLYLIVTQAQQYLLTTGVSPAGGGTINPASDWHNNGTQVMVTAAANPGYQFTGFSGSLTGGSPGYVIMNSNKSVTANFTQLSQVAATSFSPAAGTYPTTQNVAIATTTGGASIRYTLDGTTPSSTAGTLYSGPVSVASTLTIRAIAYKSGMADSIVRARNKITFPYWNVLAYPGEDDRPRPDYAALRGSARSFG